MENTMTNEAMELATDDIVIEAAEEIVACNDIDLMKVGKGIGVLALLVGGGYLLVKKGIPFAKKLLKKDEAEVINCTADDYAEAVEAEVELEDEE